MKLNEPFPRLSACGSSTDRHTHSAIPPELAPDVRAYLAGGRSQVDRSFLAVRLGLGLCVLGYMLIDALHAAAPTAPFVLVASYVAVHGVLWAARATTASYTRWVFAGLDLGFVLLLRHAFLLELTADPNTTMVGLFTLLLRVVKKP